MAILSEHELDVSVVPETRWNPNQSTTCNPYRV